MSNVSAINFPHHITIQLGSYSSNVVIDLEERRRAIELAKQSLLHNIRSAVLPEPGAKQRAENLIEWIDPNCYHLLKIREGLDGEIFIELNNVEQFPQFSIEVLEKEAYVWIDFKTIPPIQFRIPLSVLQ